MEREMQEVDYHRFGCDYNMIRTLKLWRSVCEEGEEWHYERFNLLSLICSCINNQSPQTCEIVHQECKRRGKEASLDLLPVSPLPLLANDTTAMLVHWARDTLVRVEMDIKVIHGFSFFSRRKRQASGSIHNLLMLQARSHWLRKLLQAALQCPYTLIITDNPASNTFLQYLVVISKHSVQTNCQWRQTYAKSIWFWNTMCWLQS